MPERSAIAPIILSGACELLAPGSRLVVLAGARRRSVEDPAHHLPGGGNRLRSGQGLRLLLGHGDRGDLRSAAHLRLPRAPGEAGAEHRRRRCRQISDDGRTYTFTLKPGIYFADDPAFKGRKRELTAHDYAYSIKRFLDPKNRSPYAFLFEGKIVGLDELRAGEENGRSTTTRDRGLETRPLHAAHPAQEAGLQLLARARVLARRARWRARRSSLRRRIGGAARSAPGRSA